MPVTALDPTTALIVVDADQKVVGALNVHDLMRAGVV